MTLACPPECTCGKHTNRNSGQFRKGGAGFTGSHSEETRNRLRRTSTSHGMTGTPTYRSWDSMLGRCIHPTNASYKYYGARGITVCERWSSFENFLADMGERPEGKTLDRINNDGNYEPGNCRWATRSEQNANRRDPGGWITRRKNMGSSA